eukprot:Rmarinus@m.1156
MLKEGYLEKLSAKGARVKTLNVWQKRFFILEDGLLAWKKTQEEEKVLNVLDLRNTTEVILKENRIKIHMGEGKNYKLRAETTESALHWKEAIERAIKATREPEEEEAPKGILGKFVSKWKGGDGDDDSSIASGDETATDLTEVTNPQPASPRLFGRSKDKELHDPDVETNKSKDNSDSDTASFGLKLRSDDPSAGEKAESMSSKLKGKARDTASRAKEKLKEADSAITGGEGAKTMRKIQREMGVGKDPTLAEKIDDKITLSRKHRFYGFLGCFFCGMFLSMMSSVFVLDIVDDPAPYAVCCTLGNIMSLGSSMFISGPWNHVKKMFEKTRVMATCAYLFCLLLTLVLSFVQPIGGGGDIPLILLLIILQYATLFWYTLSFIPYGRTLVKLLLGINTGSGDSKV